MGAIDTLRASLRLAGRARRSELITYLLSTLLVSVPVSFVTGLVLPYEQHLLATNVAALLLALPMPALLVRRLHDSGRSGSLVWLAMPGFTLWLARAAIASSRGIDARLDFDRWTWAVDWAVILCNLALVILVLLPGTSGANRFGEDPRSSPAEN